MLFERTIQSPIGPIRLLANDQALVGIYLRAQNTDLEGRGSIQVSGENAPHPALAQGARELDEYFQGKRTHFDTPIAPDGTEFQKTVWKALLTIPFGETRSYGEIAVAIGQPKAVRAVGAANGKNPLSIIVPCHRVIGADGSATGYAGGLDLKRWLLEHEAAQATLQFQPPAPLTSPSGSV